MVCCKYLELYSTSPPRSNSQHWIISWICCRKCEWERDTQTLREREREMCMCHLQNRIWSYLSALIGLVGFPIKPKDDSSSLRMSMEDCINHWAAAAYCSTVISAFEKSS